MPILDKHQDKWHPEPNSGCYIWTGATNGGQSSNQPRPCVSQDGKVQSVARLVCEELYGDMTGHQACHKPKCNNFLCVNGEHLYKGTQSSNEYDKPKKPNYGIRRAGVGFSVSMKGVYYGFARTMEDAVKIRDDALAD